MSVETAEQLEIKRLIDQLLDAKRLAEDRLKALLAATELATRLALELNLERQP